MVGPNGCGKSNIVDAIRWVTGEQSVKQLRGKSMEDVIFSGTETKPPLNMAEVTITLLNENGNIPEEYRHFSEIMLSRRLFRSGESGYFINKQACRLKDIQNLLMGTGVGSKAYAIIEQGRIANLIDAGPEERRFFIEEAAGITRYKSRRREALQKIEKTKENLVRLNDIIGEVKQQMRSLKRQARKAERYKKYQKQIEDLEVMLAAYHYDVIRAEMRETEALLESLHDRDLGHESEMAKLEAAIENIKHERAVMHQRISEQKAKIYECQRTIDKLEGDIKYRIKDLGRLETECNQLRVELGEIEGRNRGITAECQSLKEEEKVLQREVGVVKGALKEAEEKERAGKEHLSRLNQTVEAKKIELINLSNRKAAYEKTLENASKQKRNLSRRLDQIKIEKKQTESESLKLKKEVAKAEKRSCSLKKDLQRIAEGLESQEKQLCKKREDLSRHVRKVQRMEAERQKLRSRYSTLKKMDENYEWFKKGVRAIMTQNGSRNPEETGIHGLVADIIDPEPGYEDAVEVALSETLQYVIVEDQKRGAAAIDFLRAESAGKSGFVPIKTLKGVGDANETSLPDGREALINNIKVKDGYEQLVRSLLGHVVVAKDLQAALKVWNQNGHNMVVTLQGDRVCPQGILTGGSQDKEGSGIMAKKKEIKDLAERIFTMETSLQIDRRHQKDLESETVIMETSVQKARQLRRKKSEQLVEIEKELFRLGEKLKQARRHMEILDLEIEQIEGEQADVAQELSGHQDVLSTLAEEIRGIELAITKTNDKIQKASKAAEAAHQQVVELKLKLTSLHVRRDNCQNTLQRLEDFRNDRLKKLNQVNRKLREKMKDIAASQGRLAQDRLRLDRLYRELETMEEALTENEAEYQVNEGMLEQNAGALSKVRSSQEQTRQKIQQLELKQSERRMKCDHLVSRIKETYHRDIQTEKNKFNTEDFSVDKAEKLLRSYRERILRIGEVNLAAISEYETVSERYRLLTDQHNDLVGAIDTLHQVIKNINRTSLKQFMKTFKAVNEKLQTVFPQLFDGGTARLSLLDPMHPLESGISFLVQPPGKKLSRMSLLSGGEKALAATALIYSLFLIKPASFCVLDEIDAPLDEVNVSRANRLLKEISKACQVIMVTHSKQSMEMADALFGVTMEEKGVSKLVSLKLTKQ